MEAVHFSEMSINFYQTTGCQFQNTVLFIVIAIRASNLTKILLTYTKDMDIKRLVEITWDPQT
jgi:hypothetical protein